MAPKTDSDNDNGIIRQFNELKKKHPDAMLLFRRNNFYELYKQDAVKAASGVRSRSRAMRVSSLMRSIFSCVKALLSSQFFRLCSGSGMRPPRAMNSAALQRLTGMTGALPSRPPNATVSSRRTLQEH